MQSSPPARKAPVVAAFDFDGTLSTRDNFVPFLCRIVGTPTATQILATSGVRVAGRGRSKWGRDAVKAEVLRRIFTGYDAERLDKLGRAFAFDVMRRHLRPQAVDRVDWHRTQGHRLVIVSASLGVYVRPIAERLRFDAVLATELEVGTDGKLTGQARGRERPRRREGTAARRVARRPARLRVGLRRQLGRPRAVGSCRPAGPRHEAQPVRAETTMSVE